MFTSQLIYEHQGRVIYCQHRPCIYCINRVAIHQGLLVKFSCDSYLISALRFIACVAIGLLTIRPKFLLNFLFHFYFIFDLFSISRVSIRVTSWSYCHTSVTSDDTVTVIVTQNMIEDSSRAKSNFLRCFIFLILCQIFQTESSRFQRRKELINNLIKRYSQNS